MKTRPVGAAAAVLLAALPLLLAGCGSAPGKIQTSFGPPKPEGLFVVQPPPGGRFHFVVHVADSNPGWRDPEKRLARVRQHMASRCDVDHVLDLYSHVIGHWPDGSIKVSYAVGVVCRTPPSWTPAP